MSKLVFRLLSVCAKHFQDRYIPVFDPEHDTFSSVRARSSMLLNTICTIGYRVETRMAGQPSLVDERDSDAKPRERISSVRAAACGVEEVH